MLSGQHEMGKIKLKNLFISLFIPFYRSMLFSLLQLRLVALNEPYAGDLQGGVRNADLTCHKQARRAGTRNFYRRLSG